MKRNENDLSPLSLLLSSESPGSALPSLQPASHPTSLLDIDRGRGGVGYVSCAPHHVVQVARGAGTTQLSLSVPHTHTHNTHSQVVTQLGLLTNSRSNLFCVADHAEFVVIRGRRL